MPYPSILVPVDGSAHSQRAVEYATKFACYMSLPILLIHCHKSFPALLGEPYFQKAITKIQNEANQRIQFHREFLQKEQIEFTERMLQGDPGAAICEVADLEKCEMIVMGSRGRSDFKGLLLGSVAHKVIQSAPCPVLIVR